MPIERRYADRLGTAPLTPALTLLSQTWDTAVARFLDGGSSVPEGLECWLHAYAGKGLGTVDISAMPEPFIGPLAGRPKMVFLALNPGQPFAFQRLDGSFADRVRELGSYTAWAATWPYIDGDWERAGQRPYRHHRARLAFMRRWLESEETSAEAMVAFELYPWHSTRVTAKMRPDAGVIREYVWEPISELGSPLVFAFGAPWFPLLTDELKLPVVGRLGMGGEDYGSQTPSRSVLVLEGPSGVTVVAAKHSGGAGPPNPDETRRLREAVTGGVQSN
jgi:hypothetical protein